MVDSQILSILRQRYEHCNFDDENQRGEQKCEQLYEEYKDAAGNWFGKCKFILMKHSPDSILSTCK